jgi:hypothetical protein
MLPLRDTRDHTRSELAKVNAKRYGLPAKLNMFGITANANANSNGHADTQRRTSNLVEE